MRLLGVPLVLLATLLAQPAIAAPPTIQYTPVHDEFVDTSCGFDVAIVASGLLVQVTFADANGAVRSFTAAPQLKETLTNAATQKSITINISGPGMSQVNADGSWLWVATGLWAWTGNPDTGAAGMFLMKGRLSWTGDADGNVTYKRTGTLIDLCAQLQ